MKYKSLSGGCSILLTILFVYAACSKLQEYETFKTQLGQSPYLTNIKGLVVWLVPGFELLIAVLFLFNKIRKAAFYLSLFLMSIFSAYIFSLLNFSYYIPCSCGGVLNSLSWTQHFWFNVFFCLVAIIGIVSEEYKGHPISRAKAEVANS